MLFSCPISTDFISDVWTKTPELCRYVFVAVTSLLVGYGVGCLDSNPSAVEVDWKPERKETIAPLTTAEIEANSVFGENVGKTAMGIELPTDDEIKARQERNREIIQSYSARHSEVRKPITRGPGRNAKGQFVRQK